MDGERPFHFTKSTQRRTAHPQHRRTMSSSMSPFFPVIVLSAPTVLIAVAVSQPNTNTRPSLARTKESLIEKKCFFFFGKSENQPSSLFPLSPLSLRYVMYNSRCPCTSSRCSSSASSPPWPPRRGGCTSCIQLCDPQLLQAPVFHNPGN